MTMQISTVKWFDAKKGYGFIHHPDDGDDIFVHYSQIQSDDDFKTLRTGQSVQFELDDGPKGLHALNVVANDAADSDGRAPEADLGDAEMDVGVDRAELETGLSEAGAGPSEYDDAPLDPADPEAPGTAL